MTKKRRRLVAALLLIVVMICSSLSVAAVAKKTVKKQNFTTSTSVARKKAATVKKGTTKLTFKGGQGYVKFVAPKTKTYTFVYSNLKTAKGDGVCAYIYFMKQSKYSKKYITLADVRTTGGKYHTLWMSVDGWKDKSHKGVNRCLATRYGKIKLKKGETIYMYMDHSPDKTTAKLVIK